MGYVTSSEVLFLAEGMIKKHIDSFEDGITIIRTKRASNDYKEFMKSEMESLGMSNFAKDDKFISVYTDENINILKRSIENEEKRYSLNDQVFQNHKNEFQQLLPVYKPLQLIISGVPGTGKSYYIDKCILGGVSNTEQIIRTVIHPDYTYSDFVGYIQPEENLNYKFEPGPFTRALLNSFKYPNSNIYLVIEEINRGDIASIFGDIFQLLDRIDDYKLNNHGDSDYFITNEELYNYIYNELKSNLDELDDKYLISEIINTPDFLEGKILKKSMQEAGKSMLENVNTYKRLQEDYKEYIELWIHEIKIPIATSKLIIENNKNEITKSIGEELDEIENYTEQALFYARSNTANKDYIVTKSNLQEIVNGAILKNKSALLSSKTSIELHDLEREVYTDSKWAVFIINQIIQNAIKYSKIKDRKIEIYAISKRENVVLYIKDNGIGIKKGEITRVFEKGFTGENGRTINKKSTGIGLYLCKKLCNKLGLGIELNSEKDIGTEVRIIFPKSSFMNL